MVITSSIQSKSAHSSSQFKISAFLRASVIPIGIEILLPLGLITFLSFIFDEGNRFLSVSPHPFWVVLLPIVVHHGTRRGVICTLLCSFFLLFQNIPSQELNQNLYDYYFKIMHNPIMWFVASLALGELRVRHIQENKELKQKAFDAHRNKVVLEKAFQNLKKIKEALEVRIAAEFRTPATPLRSVSRMIETSPEKVIDNFIKSVEELISPEQFSIFVVEGGRLNLFYKHNWTEQSSYLRSFEANSLIYQGIVHHQKDLCVIDKIGEKALANQGVFALPLIDTQKREAFAMIKFEKISFRELNLSNIEAIRELCKCACQAYILSLEILKARILSSAPEKKIS